MRGISQVIVVLGISVCLVCAEVKEEQHDTLKLQGSSSSDHEDGSLTAMLLDIVLGILLVTFTPVFLWFAEAQVVNYETIIRRCQVATRSVKNINKVQRSFESRPVYVKGTTRVERDAVDMELGYHAHGKAARLERVVEMYQWSESITKDSSGNETASYTKTWLDIDANSLAFKEPAHHRNPPRRPSVYSATMNSEQVLIGAYLLSPVQVNMLQKWQPCPISAVPASLPRELYVYSPKSEGGFLVFGGSLENPHVGTVRIRYNIVRDGELVSTIAVQQGYTFRPFVEADAHRTSNFTLSSESHVLDYSASIEDSTNPNFVPKSQIGAWSASADLAEQGSSHDKAIRVEAGMQRDASLQLSESEDYKHDHQTQNYADKIDQFVASDEHEQQLSCGDHCQCCLACCLCLCCKPAVTLLHQLADWSIGSGIVLLEEQDVSIPDMFRHEWRRFSVRTWVIRLVAYVLLGVGLYMLFFGPVVFVLKFIPYVGWLAEKVLLCAAMVVGIMEGLLITTLASALHRPSLLAAYLITVGVALWLGASTTGWILAGQITIGLSVLPLAVWVYQWIEEWRFVQYQKKLDLESEGLNESTHLLHTV